jgi:nitroreductase
VGSVVSVAPQGCSQAWAIRKSAGLRITRKARTGTDKNEWVRPISVDSSPGLYVTRRRGNTRSGDLFAHSTMAGTSGVAHGLNPRHRVRMSDVTNTPAAVFADIVESRRAVRRFLDEPIDEKLLRECLRLATLAPNACNLQTWEFHVVRSSDLRTGIAKAAGDQNAARTAPVLIAVVARIDTWRQHARKMLAEIPREDKKPIVERFYSRVVPAQYSVGPFGLWGLAKRVLFSIGRLFRPIPWSPVTRCEQQMWSIKSAAIAAAHLMLALRAHGVDSCPMEGFDEQRVRRLLLLPRGARVPIIVAAGKRAPRGIYAQRFRFPFEWCVRWK